MKIYVLDTNVLLADPGVLLSFPDAEIVVPETVLAELDKLKTSRVDPDLRFRGREVSRTLFDLSEQGSLTEGVPLPDGGSLRVMPFEDVDTPDGLTARNSDDRILAVAYQLVRERPGDEVRLVTNDLNMLLKAQTFGISVQRLGEDLEASFSKKYIVRPFQRYRVPLTILAMAFAVFAAVLVLILWSESRSSTAQLPTEFKSLLSAAQLAALDNLTTLQSRPNDPQALLGMGNFYYDQRNQAQAAGDAAAALNLGQQGMRYYERYLSSAPNDTEARADYAALLFYSGRADRAIQEVGTVLQRDSNHANANYNLGIFYWQGNRPDLKAAYKQFAKVAEITLNSEGQHGTYQRALLAMEQVAAEAKQKGVTLDATSTPQPGSGQ